MNIKPVCIDNGTRIIVGSQEYNLEQETSELNANVMAAFAKFANRQRIRLSREGRKAAASQGKWQTWSPPFGLRKIVEGPRKGYLEIDEDERKVYYLTVERVFEGMGLNRICRELNLLRIPTKCSRAGQRTKPGKGPFKWKYGTLWHILRNPIYKGEYWFMGQKAQVPAIISPEKWEALQAELDRRVGRRGLRASKRFYLLQSLLECRLCARRLFGKIKESQRCGNSSCAMRLTALMKTGKYTGRCPKCGSTKVRQEQEQVYSCLSKKPDPDPRSCGLRSVNMKAAELVVWNLTREIAKSSSKLRELIKARLEPQEVDSALSVFELESIDKEIAARKEQIDALLRSREVLKRTEYVNQTLETLHKEIQELTASKRRLEAELGRRQLQRERIDWVERAWKKIGNRLDTMTDQEKFDFLHAFLVKVIVGYDEKAKMHTFEPVIAIDVGSPVPLPESLREQLSQI